MKKFNLYITRRIPAPALDLISRELGDFEINAQNRSLERKELLRKVKGRDGLLCLLSDRIDAEVMEAAGPNLKILSNCAVGFENIDVAEASRRKILVTNTPGALTETTAEAAWALLFAAARRIAEGDRFTRAGRFKGWGPMDFLGQDISGKTLGVVGAGRIGGAFARMSKGFGMRVLYFSRSAKPDLERELGAVRLPLHELCAQSDFISIHVSLSPESRRLIGAKELALMKPTAVLVNTARGAVIDEPALVRALKARKIFAAGLDVYEKEPALSPGLKDLPNVVLAPHLGSASFATRTKIATLAARNLIQALKGKRPDHLVNPEALN